MDKIFIKGLNAQTIIGCYDWERQIKQKLILDLELDNPIAQAQEKLVLDYANIAKRITTAIEASAFEYLEQLAEHLVTLLQEEFSVKGLRMQIHKPGAVPNANDVGLLIER